MAAADHLASIADLLRSSGHPDIDSITVDGYTIRCTMADGSVNYLKTAHTQAGGQGTPSRPTWPTVQEGPR